MMADGGGRTSDSGSGSDDVGNMGPLYSYMENWGAAQQLDPRANQRHAFTGTCARLQAPPRHRWLGYRLAAPIPIHARTLICLFLVTRDRLS